MVRNKDGDGIKSNLIISEVQKRPCLYDTNHPHYGDRAEKARSWEEVCEAVVPGWAILGLEHKFAAGKEVQKRWRSIRDSFTKAYRQGKCALPEQCSVSSRRYQYHRQMAFLLRALQNKKPRLSQDKYDSFSEISNSPQHLTEDFKLKDIDKPLDLKTKPDQAKIEPEKPKKDKTQQNEKKSLDKKVVPKKEPFVERKQPPVEKKQPIIEKTQPIFEKEQPIFEKSQTIFEKSHPIFEKSQPIFEKSLPLFEKSLPILENTQQSSHLSEKVHPTPERPLSYIQVTQPVVETTQSTIEKPKTTANLEKTTQIEMKNPSLEIKIDANTILPDDHFDDDKLFMNSLIPLFKKMDDDTRLLCRIEVLKIIRYALQGHKCFQALRMAEDSFFQNRISGILAKEEVNESMERSKNESSLSMTTRSADGSRPVRKRRIRSPSPLPMPPKKRGPGRPRKVRPPPSDSEEEENNRRRQQKMKPLPNIEPRLSALDEELRKFTSVAQLETPAFMRIYNLERSKNATNVNLPPSHPMDISVKTEPVESDLST